MKKDKYKKAVIAKLEKELKSIKADLVVYGDRRNWDKCNEFEGKQDAMRLALDIVKNI